MKSVFLNATIGLAVLFVHSSLALAEDVNPHEPLLRELGVTPDVEGISAYLEQLHPTPEQQQRVARLIERLGNDEFAVRESATIELHRLPNLPLAALQEAAEREDPEVAWRAKMLLTHAGPRSLQLLDAVMRTIDHAKLRGMAPAVLKAMPLCTEKHVRQAARRALVTTSEASNLAILRGALSSDDQHIRRAAVAALAAVGGEKVAAELVPLLRDPNDWIRLESALALANLGDRRSLPAFGQLLDAGEVELRAKSANLLRSLTGQSFVFTAYDKPEVRGPQAKKWRDWIAGEGKTAEFKYPIKHVAQYEIGRTLVSLYNQHRVLEIDSKGEEIREIKGYQGPWGAVRLLNGNLMINWFSSHTIVEYNDSGKEVWKWSKPGVQYLWSAQRLPNGNTLIACNKVVIEVDPAGKTVWEFTGGNHHSDALRLENGNTLIAIMHAQGKVVEVDAKGNVVSEISPLHQPYRLQRLENGNTLITEKGKNRVVEFDPTGKKEVWSRDGFFSPDSAQRLSNGNTLVSDGKSIYEVDPSGKIVWQKPYAKSIVRRY